MSFGVMGGAYQPMGHVTVVLNRYVYGMDAQDGARFPAALSAARASSQVEAGVPTRVRAGLDARGPSLVRPRRSPWAAARPSSSIAQAACSSAAPTPRKDGLALGY